MQFRIGKVIAQLLSHLGNGGDIIVGSQENILKAKLEICDGMDKDGVLVLNGDDKFLSKAVVANPLNVKYFAIENKDADVTAKDIVQNGLSTTFTICDKIRGEFRCTIPVVGNHNVMPTMRHEATP